MQFLIMGGSDDSGNGLAYSQRLSNIAPYKTPSWLVENMNGYRRFEGCAVLLPDGTVFLTSGAQYGAALVHHGHCMHSARRRNRRAAVLASVAFRMRFPSLHSQNASVEGAHLRCLGRLIEGCGLKRTLGLLAMARSLQLHQGGVLPRLR